MKNTNLFENLSVEQTIDLNGGSVIGFLLKLIGGAITAYGIYETGKDHIYDYYYDQAYNAEMDRLESQSIGGSSSSGTMYLEAR